MIFISTPQSPAAKHVSNNNLQPVISSCGTFPFSAESLIPARFVVVFKFANNINDAELLTLVHTNTHEIIPLPLDVLVILLNYVEGNFRNAHAFDNYNKNFVWKQKGRAKLLSKLSRVYVVLC